MQHYTADDPERWVKANARFHELIITCSQNTILVRLLTDLRHQGMRGRMVTGHVPGHMVRRNEEHKRIVDALASQNAGLVERRMCERILVAGRELVEFVRSAPEGLRK